MTTFHTTGSGAELKGMVGPSSNQSETSTCVLADDSFTSVCIKVPVCVCVRTVNLDDLDLVRIVSQDNLQKEWNMKARRYLYGAIQKAVVLSGHVEQSFGVGGRQSGRCHCCSRSNCIGVGMCRLID
jgi:hypothetical protein